MSKIAIVRQKLDSGVKEYRNKISLNKVSKFVSNGKSMIINLIVLKMMWSFFREILIRKFRLMTFGLTYIIENGLMY